MSCPNAVALVLAILVVPACTNERPLSSPASALSSPVISSTVLPGPENGGEAFEPHLTIDRARPDRMTVAAMYGNPMARGGRAIWVWWTEDGGKAWSGRRVTPPMVGGKPAGWAPDVITGTMPDGAVVVTSMGGAAAPRTDGLGGIVVTRHAPTDTTFAAPVLVMHDRRIGSGYRALSYDKPWMAIDTWDSSAHRGNVYVIAGALDFELPTRSWAETPPDITKIILVGLDFVVSRDGAQSFSPSRRIADSVFGADMIVGPAGGLEIAYPGKAPLGTSSAIMHLRSIDGGNSFDAPIPIVTAGDSATVSGPLLAARPNGDIMACWSEHVTVGGEGGAAGQLRCSIRQAAGAWGNARVGVPVPAGVSYSYPSLVGTAKAWYLLLYLIDSVRTEVTVYRSSGQTDFTKLVTLATNDSLGLRRWCFARDCRFQRNDLLMAGDYMSLGAGGGQLVAAYVLPRPGRPLAGSAAVHVSRFREP